MIIYVPPTTTCQPVVDSWIEQLEAAEFRPLLSALFTRYVDPTMEYCRRNFKFVVPLPLINQVNAGIGA